MSDSAPLALESETAGETVFIDSLAVDAATLLIYHGMSNILRRLVRRVSY
jgi:hypothetical protein